MIYLLSLLFFAAMGSLALVKPVWITRYFGLTQLPMAMQHEVRAVYGGFGWAMAAALGLVYWEILHTAHVGIVLTISLALLGMAAGRLVSFATTFSMPLFPVVFLMLELLLGGLLFLSYIQLHYV